MGACRLCGREVTGPVCPACGTPVAESVPWAPLGPGAADAPTVYAPGAATSQRTPTAPESPPVDRFAADAYAQPANPYAQPADPYAQPASPYAQPANPYAQPVAPYPPGAPYVPSGGSPAQPGHPGPGGYPTSGSYPPAAVPGMPPAPGGPARRPGRPVLPIVAGVLALALIVVAVLVGQRLLGGGTAAPTATVVPTTPARSTPAPPTTSTSSPVATSAAAPEDQALASLRQGASASLPQLTAAVSARAWVAQLSSKSVGIEDPLQTAANGTHAFFAVDILAEHNQLKARVRDATVILADSTTYGSRRTDTGGRPYWRSLALSPAFTSEEAVAAWCRATFAELTGAALENQCVGTQL